MDLIRDLKALLAKYEQRDDNLSIDEFCRAENISRSAFKKLQALDLAPEVRRLPGLSLQRITKEARAAWRERMAELERHPSPDTEAKQRRHVEQRREAGGRGGRPKGSKKKGGRT